MCITVYLNFGRWWSTTALLYTLRCLMLMIIMIGSSWSNAQPASTTPWPIHRQIIIDSEIETEMFHKFLQQWIKKRLKYGPQLRGQPDWKTRTGTQYTRSLTGSCPSNFTAFRAHFISSDMNRECHGFWQYSSKHGIYSLYEHIADWDWFSKCDLHYW